MIIQTGVEICPFQTVGGVNVVGGSEDDVIIYCQCNGDGTFSHISGAKVSSEIENPPFTYDGTIIVDNLIFNCKLWDYENERCGAKVSDTIRNKNENENITLITLLEKVLGLESERDSNKSLIEYLKNIVGLESERDSNNSLIKYLKNIVGTNSEKLAAEGTGSSLLRELNHMHGAHWHPEQHECPDIPVNCGTSVSGIGGFGTPFATVLIAEYLGNQDLDNNDHIYGIDFKVSDSADKPKMLLAIETDPEWVEPPESVSWSEILEWSLDRENVADPLNP